MVAYGAEYSARNRHSEHLVTRRRRARGKFVDEDATATLPQPGCSENQEWNRSQWQTDLVWSAEADHDDDPWGGWDEVVVLPASSSGARIPRDESPATEYQRLSADSKYAVPRPGLLERRAAVNHSLLQANVSKSRWKVLRENKFLEIELERCRSQLEDTTVEQQYLLEAEHWRKEVRRLRVSVEDHQQREMEAIEAEQRQAEAEEEIRAKLQEEEALIIQAESAAREITAQLAHCQTTCDEISKQSAALKQRVEQQAVLGFAGGGTAQLFVAALPALDFDAILRVRQSINAQLQQLQATEPL